MSLLKRSSRLPVYKQASGWEYPWAIDAYEDHLAMHWTHHEIDLSTDMADYKASSEEEQKYIKDVMQLFTGNEVRI